MEYNDEEDKALSMGISFSNNDSKMALYKSNNIMKKLNSSNDKLSSSINGSDKLSASMNKSFKEDFSETSQLRQNDKRECYNSNRKVNMNENFRRLMKKEKIVSGIY